MVQQPAGLHCAPTLTELKDSEKTAHLDAPVNPSGLFGAAVEMITEHFVEAQKQSEATSHFLPKRAGVKYPVRSCTFSVQSVGRPQASSAAVRSEHEPAVRSRQPWPKGQSCFSAEESCTQRRRVPVAGGESNGHVCVLTVPLCSAIKLKNTQNSPQYQGIFPPLTLHITHSHTRVVLSSPPPNGELPLMVCSPPPPLSQFTEAWQALLGVSEWVMKSMKNGYKLQFFHRPPRFNGVLMSAVRERNASVLREEIHLLAKPAVETVALTDRESGFYSRYFLVPKKDGGLRPILDLRPLNRALFFPKCSFKMIMLRQILSHISPGD